MAEFVSDCPRCKAKLATLDVYSSIVLAYKYDWKHYIEIACICRTCKRISVSLVSRRDINDAHDQFLGEVGSRNLLPKYPGSINDIVGLESTITLKDLDPEDPPEHLPENIEKVVEEANRCLSAGCWNASAAMYRLALDLATKSLLPNENEPTQRVRRSLGLRMEWLFANGVLPAELVELADCLKEDGNDGAHDGSLGQSDAEDLHDFAYRLLDRLYSEPQRLKLAAARRAERRKGQ